MNIHSCRRCDGSGHLAGGYSWEIPWTQWAASAEAAESSVLRPYACPDCGGTGALLELAVATAVPSLPSRRGLPQNHYAFHVAALLRLQGGRSSVN